ncbi:MAG: hypothetical protein J2P57_08725 [Acidimicrobiaceae bacterium]|nr:hypothetical protein [Acidimicrobiaceae bacterium]
MSDDDAEVAGDNAEVTPDDAEAAGATDRKPDAKQAPASRLTPDAEPPQTALSPKVEAWRKRSATGAILTGFAFGLREALETERKDPPIVMETSGDPPRDLPVEAELEDHRPRKSVVNIRPWMLPGGEADTTISSGAPSDEPTDTSPAEPAAVDPADPAGGDPAQN